MEKRIKPKKVGGREGKIDLEKLKEDVQKYPDAYQYERAKRFGVYQNAIFCALKKLNITYKKSLIRTKRDEKKCQDNLRGFFLKFSNINFINSLF